MKKLISSIFLLSAIFIMSQAFGQDYQTKGSGNSTKKMTKSTTTTTQDPKATTTQDPSETAPASVKPPEGEKQDGKPATTGTMGQKGSTSGMTTAGTIPETQKIYTESGILIATVDGEGWIRSPENRLMAQYNRNGEYYNKNRVKAGYVKNGVIFDKDGNKFAKITKDGNVTGMDDKIMGHIDADGNVTDNTGKKLGYGPGVERNILAVLFFYQGNMASK